ncbi:MAG: ABC transporter permease [Chloroflexi bacterium]|nr:ABC transporter permease [Chloroflexota bacterium]
MRRFRALIKKEMTHMLRDPRTLIFIFIMPILQLVLLGYANNTDIKNVPTVVFDQSNSVESRSLLDAFKATGYFSFDYVANNDADVNRLINGGNVKVGIVIPPTYSSDLASGRTAQVSVLIDGSDPTIASAVLSAATLAGQAKGASIRAQQLALQGVSSSMASASPIDVRTRVLYNPDLLGSYDIVPGLIAMILFQTATSLTALAIVRERERGTIEQLIVTPIRSWELILAKIIPYILVSFANTILILVVGTFLFGVPLRGSLILLFALTGLYLLPTLGLGLLISTMAQTQQQAQLMSMPIMLPSFMLSGFIFPISSLPIVLQAVGNLLPLTYFIYIMRAIVIKGAGLDLILPQTFAAPIVFPFCLDCFCDHPSWIGRVAFPQVA